MIRSLRVFATVISCVSILATASSAQTSRRTPALTDPNCTYETCALGLTPVWDGLAVTQGVHQRQVGALNFFWPNDVSPLFAANDSAFAAASEAVRVRTIAAILTDGGIALLAAGIARAGFQRDMDGLSMALAGAGVAALGVSVPFQFAADGFLSRAVWWHNTRFAR